MPPLPDETQSKSLPPPWDRIFSLGTRTFVWGLLLAILYLLRPFLLLIFLTFVFAYIQAHGVDGLAHRIKRRGLRVTLVGTVFLGTILATGFTLAPQIEHQTAVVANNWEKYLQDADKAVHKFLTENPSIARLFGRGPLARPVPPPGQEPGNGEGGAAPVPVVQQPTPPKPDQPEPLVTNLVKQMLGFSTEEDASPVDREKLIRERIKTLREVGSDLLGYISSFLLSLLFSFLIVLDLPKIARGISGLAHTKIGFIYDEVADNIRTFGRVLGRALEAQLLIAIVNTVLTAIGIWLLGLPNLVFLSAIVFLCSFIPVAGVFISSTPICLLALQGGGFGMVILAIALILLIHAIETYILNPRIYGHHMRMNPVLVLIVLTVGGKLFGVWGLILGIPIVNYVFRHAIRREPVDDAAPV